MLKEGQPKVKELFHVELCQQWVVNQDANNKIRSLERTNMTSFASLRVKFAEATHFVIKSGSFEAFIAFCVPLTVLAGMGAAIAQL